MAHPDGSEGTDFLTDSPEGELRYKADNSGTERIKPETVSYTGASLSGPQPNYGHTGQRGIGGSVIAEAMQGKAKAHGEHTKDHDLALTPEQMMAMATKEENDFLSKTAALDGSTAVDPTLIRTAGRGNDPPSWLSEYMETQPFTDPYHQKMPGRVDIVNANKYMTEQEKLKMLRDLQRHQGIR